MNLEDVINQLIDLKSESEYMDGYEHDEEPWRSDVEALNIAITILKEKLKKEEGDEQENETLDII